MGVIYRVLPKVLAASATIDCPPVNAEPRQQHFEYSVCYFCALLPLESPAP